MFHTTVPESDRKKRKGRKRMRQEKILLDTDMGTDVDDALALIYLLKHPACRMMGITTVAGEAGVRAELAQTLCGECNVQVPVYPGCEQCMIIPQREVSAPHGRLLPHSGSSRRYPAGQALSFMQQVIRENEGEITLIGIGPFTNIAMLFRMDPELPGMLKKLVLMGGRFFPDCQSFQTPQERHTPDRNPAFADVSIASMLRGGMLEANMATDPHAAAVIAGAASSRTRIISLDVTRQVVMKEESFRQKFAAKEYTLLMKMAQMWLQVDGQITFHDPLAAVSVFCPQVCTYLNGNLEIELSGGKMDGCTYLEENPGGRFEVSSQVYPETFFREYFSVI